MQNGKGLSRSTAFAGAVLTGLLLGNAASAAERWHIADSRLDALDALLTQHAGVFAGLSVDPDAQQVIVRIARPDAAQLTGLLGTLPDGAGAADEPQWAVQFKPVRRSMQSLDAIRERVMTQEPWASLVQPVLAQIHVDIQRNVVAVGVTAITPELQQAAEDSFGAAVELYETQRHSVFARAAPAASGALSGGAIIKMADGNHCASGWPVRFDIGTWTGFTTAGHCVVNAGLLTSVSDDSSTYLGSSVAYRVANFSASNLGASWRQDSDAGVVSDFAFIGSVPVEPKVHVGGAGSNTRAFVVGSRAARVGDRVCFSGPYTGENCSAEIQSLEATAIMVIGGGVALAINGLIEARSIDGSNIAQPGDSGGPVYMKRSIGSNTVVEAVGSIEGGPVHALTPTALFVPIAKVIPNGTSLWTARCARGPAGTLSCSY